MGLFFVQKVATYAVNSYFCPEPINILNMKRTILLSIFALVATCVFVACEGEDTPINKTKGKLDPLATILLRPADGVRSTDSDTLLSAKEIVKQTQGLYGKFVYASNHKVDEYVSGSGFAPNQRDTVNLALMMYGSDIIHPHTGEILKDFLFGRDLVFCSTEGGYIKDTLAYIPNATLAQARESITKAYNDSNYTEVYRLFHEAFRFVPITGKQWRELEKQGKQ